MKLKKILLGICGATLIACVSIGTLINVSAQASTKSLFYSDGVNFTTRNRLPSDKIAGDDRYGMKLTATTDGANATFVSAVTGKFDMDFAVVSENSFEGDAFDAVYKNEYADIQELTVAFTDNNDANNSFEVIFNAGYDGNCITPTARVRARGQEAAVVSHGSKFSELSATYNASGIYTMVEGASFSNRASKSGVVTDNVKSIILSFDPDTMSVFVKPNGGKDSLVWNFSNALNDTKDIGFTLDKMENYSVSIIFSDIMDGREANLLLYSINGRDTSWHYLANDEKVGISANIQQDALVGSEYLIPMPTLSDNFVSGEVTVIGPISNETYDLEEGMSFVPSFAGSYSLIYNCLSKTGVVSSAEYAIQAYNEKDVPIALFETSSILYEESYGVGSSILLPTVNVQGGLLKSCANAFLTVYCDGAIVDNYEKISDYEKIFTFTNAGSYVFIFSSPDGLAQQEYSFEIENGLPKATPLNFPIEVAFNENFSIPQWKIEDGEEKCSYEVKTVKPNGAEVVGDTVFTDELGCYTVTYSVAYGVENTIQYQRVFNVKHRTEEMFASSSVQISSQVGTAWFNNAHSGLKLSANSGFTAQYNHLIDLSDNTKDDLLVEFLVIPDEVGIENINSLTFNFTDAENDKNYFSVSVLSATVSAGVKWETYIKANATDQLPSGWTQSQSKLFVSGQYGTSCRFSFSGKYGSGEPTNQTIKLFYDNAERAIYATTIDSAKWLVVDFDDSKSFTNLWSGLTNGKVKMSIQLSGYSYGSACLLIKSLDGFDFSNDLVTETENPFIILDLLDYERENLPVAVVGKSYDLFTANSYSKLQGTLSCNTKVFLNYGTAEVEEIDIANGFIPTKEGIYTVEYSSVDSYGKQSIETLSVKCVSELSYKEIVSNVSSVDNQNVFVGERCFIKPITTSGGSGRLVIDISIKNKDTEETVAFDQSGEFILEKPGSFSVVYKVVDYLGTEKIFAYDIACSISANPIINDEVYLPNGFISGYEYELPEINAYDYSLNGKKYKANFAIYILNDSGEVIYNVGQDRTFVPDIEYGEDISVKYFVFGANGYVIKEYSAKVLDAVDFEKEEVDVTKLFVYENIESVQATATGIRFQFQENAKISYANSLTNNNIGFKFGTYATPDENLGLITIYLTDSKNPEECLRIDAQIDSANNKCYLYFNGDMSTRFELTGYLMEHKEYNFIFDSTVYPVKTYMNGKTFNNFSSGKVNVDFVFNEVQEKSTFCIGEIGSFFVGDSTDWVSPTITFKEEITNTALVNTTVVIPAAIVSDVVSPNSSVKVSVKYKGKVVADINGCLIDDLDGKFEYKFIPKATGDYRVTYTYSDKFGNSDTYNKVIHVYETTAPVIEINGIVFAQYKVGESVAIPDYTVSDNNTSEEKIISRVYIVKPSGVHVAVTEDYTFEVAGTYILRYVAYDEFYNYMIIEYTIEVVE